MASLSYFSSSQKDFEIDQFTDSQMITWFQAMPICRILEFSNTVEVLNSNVWAEYRQKVARKIGRPSWYINEFGLYQLMFKSNSKEASCFQRWVFESVLPVIRKTGGYGTTSGQQQQTKIVYSSFDFLADLQSSQSQITDLIMKTDDEKVILRLCSVLKELSFISKESIADSLKPKPIPPPKLTYEERCIGALKRAAQRYNNVGIKAISLRSFSPFKLAVKPITPTGVVKETMKILCQKGEGRMEGDLFFLN